MLERARSAPGFTYENNEMETMMMENNEMDNNSGRWKGSWELWLYYKRLCVYEITTPRLKSTYTIDLGVIALDIL